MQLPLGIELQSSATLKNFVVGQSEEAYHALTELLADRGEQVILIHGAPGTGKTHLLMAACRAMGLSIGAAAYVPLKRHSEFDPRFLIGLEEVSLVCVDDIDAVAATAGWEQSLFDLYNRAEPTGTRLLLSSRCRASEIGIVLPDLESRLVAAVSFALRHLDDIGRERALRERARERGFDMSKAVVRYLMRRIPRDMHALMSVLEQLDRTTLAEQRRATIPLVKRLLDGG